MVNSWVLQCCTCGSVVGVSAGDATNYACTEWPQCCGEVMALGAEPKALRVSDDCDASPQESFG